MIPINLQSTKRKVKQIKCPFCKSSQQALTWSCVVCTRCRKEFYFGDRSWMIRKPQGVA